MFCSKCGVQLNEGSVFCSRCGARVGLVVEEAAGDVSPKSRLATSLLAIFLGWVGAHRFYTGKIGTAVVMLLIGIATLICQFGAMLTSMATPYEDELPPLWFLFWGLSMLLGAAVWIWALVDFIIAVTGNFRDNHGKIIKKW